MKEWNILLDRRDEGETFMKNDEYMEGETQ